MAGRSPYAPPELVKYALVRGVGQSVVSASNSATDCSCDCTFDFKCTNVADPFSTDCTNDTGSCTTQGGASCP